MATSPTALPLPVTLRRRLILAPLVVDADACMAAPGALLLEGGRVIASGSPASIGRVDDAERRELRDEAVLPALVNVHAHLDLSHLVHRPQNPQGEGEVDASAGVRIRASDPAAVDTVDFPAWAAWVRRNRATSDAAIAASVDRGIKLSRAGGVAAVGDIAGNASAIPYERLRGSSLAGVSYVEYFGLGDRQERTIAAMSERVRTRPEPIERRAGTLSLGLQPHAPYSCGPAIYAAAAALGVDHGVPLATHLAETLDELRFARDCGGAMRAMLEGIKVWNDSIVPLGAHPVDALAATLARGRWLVVHLNAIEAEHVTLLAAIARSERGAPDAALAVAYCPRSSAFFGHPAPGESTHRYRELLDAGVCVALGTDGLPSLDRSDRISPLDEMRLLHRRDGTDPRLLLRMATINGAMALGLDATRYIFAPGAEVAGVLARPVVRPSIAALVESDADVRWLA